MPRSLRPSKATAAVREQQETEKELQSQSQRRKEKRGSRGPRKVSGPNPPPEKRKKSDPPSNQRPAKRTQSSNQSSTNRAHSSSLDDDTPSNSSSSEEEEQEEEVPKVYNTSDLEGVPVTIRISIHDQKQKAVPQFVTGLNIRGKESFRTNLKIGSSHARVESVVAGLLVGAKKSLVTHRLTNVSIYYREHPQTEANPDPFATKKPHKPQAIASDEDWKKALLMVAFKSDSPPPNSAASAIDSDHESDNSLGPDYDDVPSSGEKPNALHLDLICVTTDLVSAVGASSTATAITPAPKNKKKSALEDKDISIALYLMPMTVKDTKAGNLKISDIDNEWNKPVYVETLHSTSGKRVGWSSVRHAITKAAMGDERYKNMLGKKSSIYHQPAKNQKKVEHVSTNCWKTTIWGLLRRRAKSQEKPEEANGDNVAYLRLSLGKKKEDTDPYQSDDDVSYMETQDALDHHFESPEKESKKRSAAEERERDNVLISEEISDWLQAMLHANVPHNEYYHALTREHFDVAVSFWEFKVKHGDQEQYMNELFPCDDDKPSSWPKLSMLPREIRPGKISEKNKKKYGGVPKRGAYEIDPDTNLPKSYGDDGEQNNSAMAASVLALAEGLKARNGPAIPPEFQVRIKQKGKEEREKDLSIKTSEEINLFDAIYNSQLVKDAKIRHWDSSTRVGLQNGTKEIKITVIDEATGLDKFKYGVEDLKRHSTTSLFYMKPKDAQRVLLVVSAEETVELVADEEEF